MSSSDRRFRPEEGKVQENLQWDAIDYTPAQERHRRWVENAGDRDKKLSRMESALPFDLIEGDTKSREFLEKLEEILEETYAQFHILPDELVSYKRYGNEQRDFNRGGDDIYGIIDYVRKKNIPIQNIATVIGDGYPLEWRKDWPKSKISVFDINPLQHVVWGHTIQSSVGADKGYLVDAGVKEWMREFLRKTQPDVLYLSNIVKFLQHTPQQVEDLADVVLEHLPSIIICTNPIRSKITDTFGKRLEAHYTVEFLGAATQENIPTGMIYLRKDVKAHAETKKSFFANFFHRS